MSKVAMLAPITLLLFLAACARNDPVDENAIMPPDGLVGDASATGLAAPANAAMAEAEQQAAVPSATGGLTWTYNAANGEALFGPPGTPAFSIQCQKPKEGERQLVFVRFLPPTTGASATLSFTGNGQVASVPIAAVTNPDGVGGHWRAAVPPDDTARDVAETFSGPGTVELSISGTPPLVVPAGAEPRRVLSECLRG